VRLHYTTLRLYASQEPCGWLWEDASVGGNTSIIRAQPRLEDVRVSEARRIERNQVFWFAFMLRRRLRLDRQITTPPECAYSGASFKSGSSARHGQRVGRCKHWSHSRLGISYAFSTVGFADLKSRLTEIVTNAIDDDSSRLL
jgi:hypothetical protein